VAAILPTGVSGQQKLSGEGLQDLANQITAGVTKERKQKIGVLPFVELDGRPTMLGAFLSEELTTKLFTAGGFEIVERTLLGKVMAQLKLNASGAIDADQAKQIGKLAGVDAIVTGTITDLQSSIALNCRLIDVLTGRVFGAAQTRIVKDDDIKAVMNRSQGPAGGEENAGATGTGLPNATPRGPSVSAAGLQFTMVGCTRSANSIECLITVVTRQDQEVRVGCDNSTGTKAFDTKGQPLRCGRVTLVGQRTGSAWGNEVTLVSNVGAPLVLVFEGATQDSRTLSRLDIAFAFGRSALGGVGAGAAGAGGGRVGWSAVQFRNVPVQER